MTFKLQWERLLSDRRETLPAGKGAEPGPVPAADGGLARTPFER